MTTRGRMLTALVLVLGSLAWISAGRSAPETTRVAGNVLAVDASQGSIVVGDMGPLLDDGRSQITRRTIRVTSATTFTEVARTNGVTPNGWVGGYVATMVSAKRVKPGDFVAVTVRPGPHGSEAVEVTVVDTSTREHSNR
jgi:FtsP/CotA-like multicopper oxidase with cupredoxin domain